MINNMLISTIILREIKLSNIQAMESLLITIGAENVLTVTSRCAFPEQNITLKLKCTVTSPSGGSSTVWRGSFFNCPSENNKITFRHSRFVAGATETCTDGSIVGQSLSSDNGRFTSQLSVRVSTGIIGQYLNCKHDDGSTILPVGSVKMSAGWYTKITVTVQGCEV